MQDMTQTNNIINWNEINKNEFHQAIVLQNRNLPILNENILALKSTRPFLVQFLKKGDFLHFEKRSSTRVQSF